MECLADWGLWRAGLCDFSQKSLWQGKAKNKAIQEALGRLCSQAAQMTKAPLGGQEQNQLHFGEAGVTDLPSSQLPFAVLCLVFYSLSCFSPLELPSEALRRGWESKVGKESFSAARPQPLRLEAIFGRQNQNLDHCHENYIITPLQSGQGIKCSTDRSGSNSAPELQSC